METQLAEAWLDDPHLPQLRTVLDAQAMQPFFSQLFEHELQTLDAEIADCRIERVQYRKHKRCRVLYRLVLRHHDGRHSSDQWFAAKLVRPGRGRRQFLKENNGFAMDRGVWQPAYLLEPLDLIVYAFPHDPGMPGLALAGSAQHIAGEAQRTLRTSLVRPIPALSVAKFEKVKYMPGKRCVLKFDLLGNGARSDDIWSTFFSKTFSDGMAEYHFRILKTAHEQLAPWIHIPRPVHFWPEANTFWQDPWPGRPLIDQLGALPWQDLFLRLGEMVATLHTSTCEGLRRIFHRDIILHDAEEDAAALQWLLPQYRDHFQAMLAILKHHAQDVLPAELPQTLIHGALRIEQLLANDDDFAVVDLDALSIGDPLFDVAEFWTSLQYLAFTRNDSLTSLNEAAERFVDAYAERVPWKVDRRRMAWYAAAFLFGKMHDTLKNIDMPALKRFEEILALQESWAARIHRPA
ncbi:MAG: phosphotransferase [candidate division KSB1 bacterium]|nr:phosphotransferase [candidate division KSB1 bacterium]